MSLIILFHVQIIYDETNSFILQCYQVSNTHRNFQYVVKDDVVTRIEKGMTCWFSHIELLVD